MATTLKYLNDQSPTLLLSTHLNSLANNAIATGVPFSNTTNQYIMANLELFVNFTTGPTASTAVSVWFLQNIMGSGYEAGAPGVTPTRLPDAVLPVFPNANSGQRLVAQVLLPPGELLPCLKNDSTGQSFGSANNYLAIKPFTYTNV
jgi:hypothetical protein